MQTGKTKSKFKKSKVKKGLFQKLKQVCEDVSETCQTHKFKTA